VGRLPSCQLALARHGELLAFDTFGAPDGTRYAVMSCTKPLVAAAVWAVMGRDVLDPERRVADFVEGFGANGKEEVTLHHVLLHTAGFPRAPLGPEAWTDSAARRSVMASWRLSWAPGSRCEYHATSAHWVLAAVLESVTGADFRDVVHERVTAPLGLPRLLGVDGDDGGPVADLVGVGRSPTPEELEAATGIAGLTTLDLGEVSEAAVLRFNEPSARAAGVPGAGGVATAADLALFYQGLLADPAGAWDPEVLADGTGHVRTRLVDPLRMVAANRTLGLLVAGDDGGASARGMGTATSPLAFGHDGHGGQLAWADPATGLSFCYLTNGIDRDPLRSGRRAVGLATRAARCAAA
jgi:CubicO group peptidase (beta-lactamase class C family)